jgi:hypothetical protein
MKHEVNIKQNLIPDTGWDSSDGIVILYGLCRPRTEFRTYPDQPWRPSNPCTIFTRYLLKLTISFGLQGIPV